MFPKNYSFLKLVYTVKTLLFYKSLFQKNRSFVIKNLVHSQKRCTSSIVVTSFFFCQYVLYINTIYDILQNKDTGLKNIAPKYSKNQFLLSKKTIPGVQIIVPRCPKNTIVYIKKQFLVSKKSFCEKNFKSQRNISRV